MLQKILKVTNKTNYNSEEYIFKEGEYAKSLYSVIEGKVVLELQKTTNILIWMTTITPGYSFGFPL